MAIMKKKIKQAAIELFFEKGYFATSMNDIAKACGIQKASIYYHYPGKEELLYNILETTMDDLTKYLENEIEEITDVEERLRVAVRSHVRFHLDRQQENFIANSELRGVSEKHFKDIVTKRDRYEKIFQELIENGVEKGILTCDDIKILSYAILTLCTAGASWYKPSGRLSVDEIAEIYENFIISGLKQDFNERR